MAPTCKWFHSILAEPTNEHSLDVIERAQFIVCLDQAHPDTSQLQFAGYETIQDYQKSVLANRVLHGNGSKQNSSNRWFDTAVQVNCNVVPYNTCIYACSRDKCFVLSLHRLCCCLPHKISKSKRSSEWFISLVAFSMLNVLATSLDNSDGMGTVSSPSKMHVCSQKVGSIGVEATPVCLLSA